MTLKSNSRKYIYLFLLWPLVFGCGVTRYIPEDEKLYQGARINLSFAEKPKDKSAIQDEMESLLHPKPNWKFMGWRLPLLVNYRVQHGKGGFITRFLNKKIGEEPVYLSDIDIQKTEELIANRIENKGFFLSQVNSLTEAEEHFARVSYDVEVSPPYKLKTYNLDTSARQIHVDIKNSMENTLLKPETRFDLQNFKSERVRIDEYLKSIGYYNFNSDFLIFEVDTNQYEKREFDLFLRLKSEVPHKSTIPYKLDSIKVYPNYSLESQTTPEADTTTLRNIEFIQNEIFFKPQRLTTYILLDEGEKYDPLESKVTSRRLSTIGTYKFVNIRYEEVGKPESTDTLGFLNTKIFLSPLNKRSVRAEMQAVMQSNNFAGPNLMLTYTNRNLFRGGELLNISGNVGYLTQLTGGKNSGLSSTQFGLKSDLILPRLVPINPVDRFRYEVPKTKTSLGVEYFNRSQLYTLRTFSGSFGYTWNASKYTYHEFNPVDINVVKLSNTTPAFEEILAGNSFLANSFNQRFISGLNYSFTFSELNNTEIKNPLFFISTLEIAGTLMSLTGKEEFLGLQYAQYSKVDGDIHYQFTFGRQKIVTRLFGGIGVAYGNSETLPYSRQYFSGGPYSVRAFRIRSLGPGTYTPLPDDVGSFFDQTGDIRLEANIEYRFPIVSVLHGAAFVDAGNVWLRHANADLPGGKFSSDFLSELGMGTGLGLRVDIQGFVIRGDFAFPIHKPTLPKGKRFLFGIDELLFNFAFGYPF